MGRIMATKGFFGDGRERWSSWQSDEVGDDDSQGKACRDGGLASLNETRW